MMDNAKEQYVIARMDSKLRDDFRKKWKARKYSTESEVIRQMVRKFTYGKRGMA
jgi:Arc/MetJ-type ribon-helix-helix transcriptional regulator